MKKIFKVLSVSTVKSGGSQILKLAGDGSLSLLATGKKTTAKIKEHAESEGHIMACQTETAAASAVVTCGGEDLKQFSTKLGKMFITSQKML